ncbi:MAG: methyltransferase domain-containing protein [Hamadaea sp.]|uniref:class I SAM-dependent methyltransferase n=1 Tax=Hamadaea sp. TaxID=2024425 RepID=UPI0017D68285|nr:class I SAM-dependent methyltransferase [Hamadaea sp.]NUT22443.1 methyltransferase domain-containing protein [Hamadaea sp.]
MTDLAAIARRQYASLDPLAVRIRTHQRYSARPDDVDAAVRAAVGLSPADDLLDVGCGTGAFLLKLAGEGHLGQLIGLDAAPAAVTSLAATPGVTAVEGDAQRLPFDDATFDVVTARHMLYHVPDPLLALREAHRVLRPGGRFAAVVNFETTTPILMGLLQTSVGAHGFARPRPSGEVGRGPRMASVHDGNLPTLVQQIFGYAQPHRHANELVFPDPGPMIDYAVSSLTGWGVADDDPRRDDVIATLTENAAALFADGGPVRDPKGYVIVTATKV